jgi:hypothetical protein
VKNDKNILDKYLQAKVEEAHFDMQEAHWLKALEAIEGEEASKKVWPWLRTLLLAGLLLVSGSIIYFITKNKDEKQIAKNKTEQKISIDSTSTAINNATMPPTTNETNAGSNTDKVIKAKNNKPAKTAPTNTNIDNNINNQRATTPQPIHQKSLIAKAAKSIKNIFSKPSLTPEEIEIQKQKKADALQQKSAKQAQKKAEAIAKQTAAAEQQQLQVLAIQQKAIDKANAKAEKQKILQLATEAKQVLLAQQKQALLVSKQQAALQQAQKNQQVKQNAEAKKILAAEKAQLIKLQKEQALLQKQKIVEAKAIAKLEAQKMKKAKKLAEQIEKNNAETEKNKTTLLENTSAVTKTNTTSNPEKNILTKSEKVAIPVAKSNPRFIDAKDLKAKPKKLEATDNTDWTSVKSVQTIVTQKKEKIDTATVSSTTIENVKQKTIFTKSTKSITATVQMSLAAVPKNANASATWQASPYAGIGYWLPINSRLDVHAQIGATYINGLQYKYTATNYTYGFGIDSTMFTMQYKTLYQLCIPISANYKISLKQSMMAGLGANIGLDVLSNVKQFNTNTNANAWGYGGGFATVAPYATLGYQYQIFSNLYMHAIYQQGLMDITNNQFFNNSNIDRNSKATIGITYKIK